MVIFKWSLYSRFFFFIFSYFLNYYDIIGTPERILKSWGPWKWESFTLPGIRKYKGEFRIGSKGWEVFIFQLQEGDGENTPGHEACLKTNASFKVDRFGEGSQMVKLL